MSKEIALKILEALGHIKAKGSRCTAREERERRVGRPDSPPRSCTRKSGHEGGCYMVYGTQRINLNPDFIVHKELPDICEKCKTAWPCADTITALESVVANDYNEEHF